MVISITWKGNRIQSAIGISNKTSSFDVGLQKFKRDTSGYSQLNNFLEKIKQEITDYYFNSLATNKVLSKEELKLHLDSILKNKLEPESSTIEYEIVTVRDIVNRFFDEISENPLYKVMTIIKYRTFKNNINKYLEKNSDILFNKIDYQFILNLAIFLSKDLKLADATIHKTLKMLSVTFNRAFDSGIINSQFYKPLFKKLFKDLKLKIDSKKFSLSKEDIIKLELYEPANENIKLTKDLFLFEIYTGQRVSDLFKTNIATVNLSDMTLNFRQTKTNELVSIPLIDKALKIISKYPNMKFPKISEQYYNRQIKELAKSAGLNDLIQIERKSLNKIEKVIKEKWELVSSHHARVTCIVNMAQNGALPEEIITVSGHSNPRSIDAYMKISELERKKRSRQSLERAFG